MTQKGPVVVGMGINKSRCEGNSASVDFAVGGNGLTHCAYPCAFDGDVSFKRLAAEAVSLTFVQCMLKGLHRSPRLVTDLDAMRETGLLTSADVSCLVIPDNCGGLPTLAALEQGIPVIAIRENDNLMQNDLHVLPWASNQLHVVENYWEAVGVMTALKAGITPSSLRRPLTATRVENRKFESQGTTSDGTERLNNS